MGIKGIYQEIGSGRRVALSKLAVEHYEKHSRPLRLAIDVSIWLFQIQSGKGGTNPAVRTFYYRLLRLISISIQPLFVFDGPNKPPFKRHKRTGPNVASIPEFLAKQLLKQFGLPIHLAPGEAEAECATLQQRGVVDAVLSEDVDTLMFGSGLTFRNWTPEASLKTKTPTHVNVYDVNETKTNSGLDRPGMILVAMMSGGDYLPEGIPGCGSKTACEAARAGFGHDLCEIGKNDDEALGRWKERLQFELRTNKNKLFKQKHKTLQIPQDFPRLDVLNFYTNPVVSSNEKIEQLKGTIRWDQELDICGLRTFCLEAFDWRCLSGAKHFIRNLSPALLQRSLRMRAEETRSDDLHEVAIEEARLIKTLHSRRQHISTDNTDELRIGYRPLDIVPIDLDAEEPDPECPIQGIESDDEAETVVEEAGDHVDASPSPRKTRKPTTYDPNSIVRIWMFEVFVKVGVPLKVQDWEESHRNAKKYEAMKALRKRTEQEAKAEKSRKDSQKGTMDAFVRVTKLRTRAAKGKNPRMLSLTQPVKIPQVIEEEPVLPVQRAIGSASPAQTSPESLHRGKPFRAPKVLRSSPPSPRQVPGESNVVDLLSPPSVCQAVTPVKRSLGVSTSEISNTLDRRESHVDGPLLIRSFGDHGDFKYPRELQRTPRESTSLVVDLTSTAVTRKSHPPSIEPCLRCTAPSPRNPLVQPSTVHSPCSSSPPSPSPSRTRRKREPSPFYTNSEPMDDYSEISTVSGPDAYMPTGVATVQAQQTRYLIQGEDKGRESSLPSQRSLHSKDVRVQIRKAPLGTSNGNARTQVGRESHEWQRRTVRLRESLHGAFSLNGLGEENHTEHVRENEEIKFSGKATQWRVDDVDIVDLTAL